MRRLYGFLLFSLLVFCHAPANAGYGEPGSTFPRFIKENSFSISDKKETYYLLRHTRGDSTDDGKFILVDKNLNIIAETPYVYNLYAYCERLSACYFFNFGLGLLPQNTWQVDTSLSASHGNLLDLYGNFNYFTKSQVEIKAEKKILMDFLNDPMQTTLPVTALEKTFTRGATLSNLKPAPAWLPYALPMIFFALGAALYFFLFWPFKTLKNFAVKKKAAAKGTQKTVYTICIVFFYALMVTSGVFLSLLTFFSAPLLYAWGFVLFLGFFGFATKQSPDKTAA